MKRSSCSILLKTPAAKQSANNVTMSMKDLRGHGDEGVVQRSGGSGSSVQRSGGSGSSVQRSGGSGSGGAPKPPKVRNPLERSKSGVFTLKQIHPNGETVMAQKRLFRISDVGVLQDTLDSLERQPSADGSEEMDFGAADSDAPPVLSGKMDFGIEHTQSTRAAPSAAQLAPGDTATVIASPAQDADKRPKSKNGAMKVDVHDKAYVPYTMEQDEGDIPDSIPEDGDNAEDRKAALKRMLSKSYKQEPAVTPPEWLPEHILHTPVRLISPELPLLPNFSQIVYAIS